MSWVAVGIGAAIGAWLRWILGNLLNSMHQHIPIGTLVANWTGGLIIGILTAFFSTNNTLPVEWRLFAITGLLGGLTTFSTFSAETVLMLQRGQYTWAAIQVLTHVIGSIFLCFIGFVFYQTMTKM